MTDRPTRPRLHRSRGERRRRRGDAGRGGPRARRAPGRASPRRLAAVRDRAGRRHRPARVPQRRRRARRPGRSGPGDRRARRCSPRSRTSSARSAAGVDGAGARASSTSTCSSSGGRGSRSSVRPAPARSTPRPTRRRRPKLLVVPHPAAATRLFVLAPLADLAPRLVPPGLGRCRSRRPAAARPRSKARTPSAPSPPGIRATGRLAPRSAQVARRQDGLDRLAVRPALDPVAAGLRPRRDDLDEVRAVEDERGPVVGRVPGRQGPLGDELLVVRPRGSPRRRSAGSGCRARTRARRTAPPGPSRTNRSSRSRTSTATRPTARS